MTIVSNNIKFLRRLNSLTQEQFSKKLGIKRSLLGAYEEARANPNLENLQNMANIFGTTVDDMIKLDLRKVGETSGIQNLLNNNNSNLQDQGNNIIAKPGYPNSLGFDNYFTDRPINNDLSQIKDFAKQKFQHKPQVIETSNTVNFVPSNSHNIESGIPFVNKNEFTNYITKHNLNAYLNSLPKIQLPNINSTNCRAFAANEEFPQENSIIIGEIIDAPNGILEGQHHILICHDGRMLFRRVYDHTRIKGCYLLSSDDHKITSTEVPEGQVVMVLKFVAHIGYSVPKSQAQNPRIKQLIEELHRESGRN